MNTLTDHDYETIRRCAVTDRRYHTFVEVELGELIDNDLEGFLDLISTRAVGNGMLSDISWSLVDFKRPGDDTIILDVSGDVSAVVALWEASR